jgi:hypothetical protein
MVDEGTLDCMENLYEYLPMFSDIYKYCYSGAVSLAQAASASIVALSLLY